MTLINAIPLIVMFAMVVITFVKAMQLHKASKSDEPFYFFWLRLNDTAMKPRSMEEAFPMRRAAAAPLPKHDAAVRLGLHA